MKRNSKATRRPTYLEIAKELHKKQPQTIMACELECKQLLKIDVVFKERYHKVLEALNWHLGYGISQFEPSKNSKS